MSTLAELKDLLSQKSKEFETLQADLQKQIEAKAAEERAAMIEEIKSQIEIYQINARELGFRW